jgi:hypothetical protein
VFGREEGGKSSAGNKKAYRKSEVVVGDSSDKGCKVSQGGQKRPPAGSQGHFQGSTTEFFTQQLTQIITSCSKVITFLQVDLAPQSCFAHAATV